MPKELLLTLFFNSHLSNSFPQMQINCIKTILEVKEQKDSNIQERVLMFHKLQAELAQAIEKNKSNLTASQHQQLFAMQNSIILVQDLLITLPKEILDIYEQIIALPKTKLEKEISININEGAPAHSLLKESMKWLIRYLQYSIFYESKKISINEPIMINDNANLNKLINDCISEMQNLNHNHAQQQKHYNHHNNEIHRFITIACAVILDIPQLTTLSYISIFNYQNNKKVQLDITNEILSFPATIEIEISEEMQDPFGSICSTKHKTDHESYALYLKTQELKLEIKYSLEKLKKYMPIFFAQLCKNDQDMQIGFDLINDLQSKGMELKQYEENNIAQQMISFKMLIEMMRMNIKYHTTSCQRLKNSLYYLFMLCIAMFKENPIEAITKICTAFLIIDYIFKHWTGQFNKTFITGLIEIMKNE